MRSNGELQQIRIIVADDHKFMRTGIVTTLEAEPQMQVVGTASSFHALPDLLATCQAHVVILDLEGMGTAPISYIRQLKQTFPHLGIVIFSAKVEFVRETLRAGATAYVTKKELEDDQLLLAIRAAKAGQCFLSPLVQDYLESYAVPTDKGQIGPKELQALMYVAQGLDNQEIALRMNVDLRTIENYVYKIRAKTGCRTRTQLGAWYRTMYGDAA